MEEKTYAVFGAVMTLENLDGYPTDISVNIAPIEYRKYLSKKLED